MFRATTILARLDRLIPEEIAADPLALFRARVLFVFALLLAFVGLVLGTGNLLAGPFAPGIALYAGSAIAVVTLLFVRSQRSLRLAIHWILAVLGAILVLISVQMGGIDPLTFGWFPLVPLAAVFLAGVRSSIAWGLLMSLAVTLLYVGKESGFAFPPPPKAPSVWVDMLGVWMMIGLTLGFGLLYAEANRRWREDRDKTNLQLARAIQAAQAASRAKSVFLANISHELRTPMNGVIGMSESLLTSKLDADQREHVETLKACGSTLLALIDDVLDFSKAEARKLVLENVAFPLHKNVRDAAAVFAFEASKKSLQLAVTIDPGVPELVFGDPVRFRQVLFNLLGNAVKFTERGRIELGVHTAGETVLFEVKDTGIGIPAAQLPRLFKPFSQADMSTTRRFGGSGLGLSIVKHLVELMGGLIHVESQLGEGTSFKVEISFRQATVPIQRPLFERTVYHVVLLVEDNLINQRVAARMLQRCGASCDIANTGKEAVEAVKKRDYDLILMDCQMPEMDGYEATREIRRLEHDRASRTKIVALTANAIEGDRERCLAVGMDDYLSKPITTRRLSELLQGS